jgi:hypothetical protein
MIQRKKSTASVMLCMALALFGMYSCGGPSRSIAYNRDLSQYADQAAEELSYKCTYVAFTGLNAEKNRNETYKELIKRGAEVGLDNESGHALGLIVKDRAKSWVADAIGEIKTIPVTDHSSIGIGHNDARMK